MIGKRSGVAALALGVVALVGLAACAPAGYDTVTEAVATSSFMETGAPPTPSPAASSGPAPDGAAGTKVFVFESGVLELGDFDPTTIGDNLFDPCTEITAEEFALAGFPEFEEVDQARMNAYAPGLSICVLAPSPSDLRNGTVRSVANGNTDREMFEAAGEIWTAYPSEILPELYHYGNASNCFARVDTKRGALVAGVRSEPTEMPIDKMCGDASSMIEVLFLHFGSTNLH